MQKYKNKKQWRDKFLSQKTVSTAILNHFESMGYNPNRKKGIMLDSFGCCWAKVEKV